MAVEFRAVRKVFADGTVAADYYRAMAAIENQVGLVEDPDLGPATPGHLLAMVDSLRNGTLNEGQRETVQQLRRAILALAEMETAASGSGLTP